MNSPAFAATVEELEAEFAEIGCHGACIFKPLPAKECVCCEFSLVRKVKKSLGIQRQIIDTLKAELAAAHAQRNAIDALYRASFDYEPEEMDAFKRAAARGGK